MTPQRFITLASHTGSACLTAMYSVPPGARSSWDTHLKSVLDEARRTLRAHDCDPETVDARMHTVTAHLDQLDGLRSARTVALFQCGEVMDVVLLDVELERSVTVASSFHMAPLARFIEEGDSRYVMALSRGEWRLFEVTGDTIASVDVPDAPKDLASANSLFEQSSDSSPMHANRTHGTGAGAPRVNMQGFGHEHPDDLQDRRYVEALGSALRDVVGHAPIAVVGLAPLAATFRDNTQVKVGQVVFTDPQGLSASDLANRLDPVENGAAQAFEASFGGAMADGLASDDQAELLALARSGNVKVLRYSGASTWWSEEAQNAGDPAPGRVDLVGQVVAEVLSHGGTVVRGDGGLAAIRRWPTSEGAAADA